MPSQIVNSHSTVKFEWQITSFSKLGASHQSDVFTVGNLKWRMKIYPRGDNKSPGKLSIFLTHVDKIKLTHVDFSFIVKSRTESKNNIKNTITRHPFIEGSDEGFGWPKFMPLTALHDHYKGYLRDDTFIIEVVVTCSTKEANTAVVTTGQTSGENAAVASVPTSKPNAVAGTGQTSGANPAAATGQTSEAGPVVIIF
ncbi:hypothetical protein MKX03_028651 [Papaver bracteatum]|nr:hypothetical protein MKX03_028651 [Papaver bracteatum]